MHGETGYIVNPYDIKTFAGDIVQSLAHPEMAKQMGEAGYMRVKDIFSLKEQAEKILSQYGHNFSMTE
jgi:glycosyltransferase involved in cell wall biosynthesis